MSKKTKSKPISLKIEKVEASVSFIDEGWEKERNICKEFLNTLQMRPSTSHLFKPQAQIPRVLYKSASFEVGIINIHEYISKPSSPVKLGKQITLPSVLKSEHLIDLLKPALREKKEKYEEYNADLSDIDMVAYIDLSGYLFDMNSPFPSTPELENEGWRSISLVTNSFCRVLFTRNSAPVFLKRFSGKTMTRQTNGF